MGKLVTVYGSACNPPHLLHQLILEDLQTVSDEVWYLPVYSHMFGKGMIDPSHRLAMAKIVADITGAEICYHEFKLKRQNPTHETLAGLQAENPDTTFAFAVGADNIRDFHKWKRWEYLAEKYTIFAYERDEELEDSDVVKFRDLRIRRIETGIEDASSTKVRAMIAEGDPEVSKYVHPDVLAYIEKHNLFRGE